jgi:ankyrin repeat protein
MRFTFFYGGWFHRATALTLLRHGADVHVRDESGHTLLHWAAFKGARAMVDLLLNQGIEIETDNRDGKTAMEYAASQGHYAIVEAIEMARRAREQEQAKDRLKHKTLGDAIDHGALEAVQVHLDIYERSHPGKPRSNRFASRIS